MSSAWETVMSWFKIPEPPARELLPEAAVRDVVLAPDAATITFIMRDGTQRVVTNPYTIPVVGDIYLQMNAAVAGALLAAMDRIEELEKKGEANG